MRKQTITYSSPVDALVAVAQRVSNYESPQQMGAEGFYQCYCQGQLGDDAVFIEWANDYRHYLALRQELDERLNHAA